MVARVNSSESDVKMSTSHAYSFHSIATLFMSVHANTITSGYAKHIAIDLYCHFIGQGRTQ